MDRNKILIDLHKYLEVDKFSDYCLNGLQLEGSEEIKKIAFTPSITLEVLEKAVEKNCQMVIAHHGLLWKGTFDDGIKGVLKERLKYALENNLNIVGYHLPLDAHVEVGNNACILKEMNCKKIQSFGKYNKSIIGKIGELSKTYFKDEFVKYIDDKFGIGICSLMYGKEEIKTVAVVSGGAASMVEQSVSLADVFITGEVAEYTTAFCKEAKQNFIALGHYNSEKLGVKALLKYIDEKYDVVCAYVEVKNRF